MSAFFGLIGILAILIGIIMFFIALIRKKPKKKSGIVAAVGFALFVIGLSLPSSSDVIDRGEEVTGIAGTDPKEAKDEVENNESEEFEDEDTDKNKEKQEKENKKKEKEQKDEKKEEKAKEEKKTKAADEYEYIVNAMSEGKVDLPKESYDLIKDNVKLFPANEKEDIAKAKDMTNNEVGSKHLNKKLTPYHADIVTIAGDVISIEEADFKDGVMTYVHMMDDDFNSFEIIFAKDAENIFEDDRIRFWGVPVGSNHFDNIAGGTTVSQIIVGSHIEKQ